jgi:hypothetical protein
MVRCWSRGVAWRRCLRPSTAMERTTCWWRRAAVLHQRGQVRRNNGGVKGWRDTCSTQGGATTVWGAERIGRSRACVRRLGGEGNKEGATGAGRTSPISTQRRLSRGNLDDGQTKG